MTIPAIILVGGEGTRLRPLTEATPKPMLPLFGRPLLSYTFDHLRTAGVERVTLACGYLPDPIEAYFGREHGGMSIDYCVEPEPRGTGGGIWFAANRLDRTFFALNGDSLREADLRVLAEFHRERNAKATILLTRAADPSRYGLVTTNFDGQVTGFVEKPSPEQIVTDQINAGFYVLEPEVLELIEAGKNVSIEREVFPRLVDEGSLYALTLPGYWLDVGTPASYLQAHLDLLTREEGHVKIHRLARVSRDAEFEGPVIVGPGASIEGGARVGPFVHIGHDAQVASRVSLRRTAVLPHAVVAAGSRLVRAIVVPGVGAIAP
jgi:mannose-1-phosphate guanylyltransferase